MCSSKMLGGFHHLWATSRSRLLSPYGPEIENRRNSNALLGPVVCQIVFCEVKLALPRYDPSGHLTAYDYTQSCGKILPSLIMLSDLNPYEH